MKTRLTITLPPDLLKTIDKLVDRKSIRNRSHAIEHLIRQSLGAKVTTAVILAGRNENNKQNPLTKKIGGEYLFEQQLSHLHQSGITNVVFCLNEADKEFKILVGPGEDREIDIAYSFEKEPLGTAGAIKHARKHFSDQQAVLVLHGDILTTIALDELIEFHQEEDALATIAVKPNIGKKQLGRVYIQGNRVTNFRKTGIEQEISIINTGVYVLNQEAIAAIPNKTPSYLESDVFPKLSQANKLRAFIFQGLWHDISGKDDHQLAEENWSAEQ